MLRNLLLAYIVQNCSGVVIITYSIYERDSNEYSIVVLQKRNYNNTTFCPRSMGGLDMMDMATQAKALKI